MEENRYSMLLGAQRISMTVSFFTSLSYKFGDDLAHYLNVLATTILFQFSMQTFETTFRTVMHLQS